MLIKKQNVPISLLWHLQIFFSILFIAILYISEQSLIKDISQSIHLPTFIAIVDHLIQKQLPFCRFFKIWLIAWPCLVLAISFIIFVRWRWFFVTFAGFLSAIYITTDKLNYNYFSAITTFSSLKAIKQLPDISASILSALSVKDISFILFFILFSIWGIVYNKYVKYDISNNPLFFFADKLTGIIFFLLSMYAFKQALFFESKYVVFTETDKSHYEIKIFDNAEEDSQESNESKQHFALSYKTSTLDFAAIFGVINFHLVDSIRQINNLIDKKISKMPKEDHEIIVKWFTDRHKLNQTKTPLWALAKNRNFIIVSLESFHPSLIGRKIKGEEISPNINKLALGGLYWPYIIDEAVSGGSSDSEFSLMSGLLPSTDVVSAFDLPQQTTMTCLPSVMVKNGYTTLSFHGYKSTFWNRNINHPIYGIQKMFFKDSFKDNKTALGFGISDSEFFIRSTEYLSKEKKPFVAYLISLSAHHPYDDIPEGYQNKFKIDEGETQALNYLRLQNYADKAIGDFISALKKNGLWENTVLIVFGDHSPPMKPETKRNMKSLMDIDFDSSREHRIPLIITIPGKDKLLKLYGDEYVGETGALNDLYPTILHLAGIDSPLGISGINLLIDPSLREPLPVMVNNILWAYNGAIYNGAINKILSDDKGIVFHIPSKGIVYDEKRQDELFLNTFIEKRIYKSFFAHGGLDFNAPPLTNEN